MRLWLVWTEQGAYEQWSRDLRGIFAQRDLAERFAEMLRAQPVDSVEIVGEDVLYKLPSPGRLYKWSAHIKPDGEESSGSGHHVGRYFDCWLHEYPVVKGEISRWSGASRPDLYVEVIGTNAVLVEAEYRRLVLEAQKQLVGQADAE